MKSGLLAVMTVFCGVAHAFVFSLVAEAEPSALVAYTETFGTACSDLNGQATEVGFGKWVVHDGGAYVMNGALYSTGSNMNVSFDLPSLGNNISAVAYSVKARAYSQTSDARVLFGLIDSDATGANPTGLAFNNIIMGGLQRADAYTFMAVGGPGVTTDNSGWIGSYYRVPQTESATWNFYFDLVNHVMTASIQSEGRAECAVWTNKIPASTIDGADLDKFWIQFSNVDPFQSFIDQVDIVVELDTDRYVLGAETNCVEWVANFEQGLDEAWDFDNGVYIPRCWVDGEVPSYSYLPADATGAPSYWTTINDGTLEGEGINWWHTMQAQSNNGVSVTTYRLFMPEVTNYMNWCGFDQVRVDWMGANLADSSAPVNMQLNIWTEANPTHWSSLGYRVSTHNERVSHEYDLAGLGDDELSAVGYLQFQTRSWHLPLGDDYSKAQRTHLFGVQLVDNTPYSVTNDSGDHLLEQHSTYLGTMFYRRYGSYSAHGFWDSSIDKYRIWFGGGIPEIYANDNVWYVETESLDPGAYMPDPRRCTMDSFDLLLPGNDEGIPRYGGDPAVLKFEETAGNKYVMFFSGLRWRGTGVGFWNEVYRAVSTNGLDWVLSPTNPVVPAATGGAAGYGSGCPSVMKVGDLYYMYYYSQYENTNAPGLYRRTSEDTTNWTDAEPVYAYNGSVIGGGQVTFIPELNKWMVLVAEYTGLIGTTGIKTAYSDDGLHFTVPTPIAQRCDFLSNAGGSLHNPGFIGDPLGCGFADMYITYGISEVEINKYEYCVRQLGYSSLHITPK